MNKFTSLTLVTMTAATLLTGVPVMAQTGYQPPSAEEGATDDEPLPDIGSRIEQGAQTLLRDLFRDVEPHMNAIGRELGLRMDSLTPMVEDLGRLMDDIGNYQAPERLANGDLLIRRKPGAPPPPTVSPGLQNLVDPAPGPETNRVPAPGGADRDGAGGTADVEL